ncbi:hypothetical protein GALL_78230 [mine drainage metagenome]|uniref:Uncharacterized protein n=1 Tax=mine drainage metagenome TaxID=410659 RepID=A0A1J5TEM4_9ZZZZ
MGPSLGMLLALAIVVLGGLLMAGIVVLLRNRDSVKTAKTESSAYKSVEPKK